MKAKTVSLKSLAVTILAFGVGIGEEGWTALARALRSNINVQLGRVRISTQDLKEVKMEDMKDVWEVTGEGFSDGILVCNLMQVSLTVTKGKYDWEQAWPRLHQISEMKEEEFVAEVKKQEDEDAEVEETSDEGSDNEEEGVAEEEEDPTNEGEEADEEDEELYM